MGLNPCYTRNGERQIQASCQLKLISASRETNSRKLECQSTVRHGSQTVESAGQEMIGWKMGAEVL